MTAQIGSAVPTTLQTTPGSTTPAPSVAAISSPQPQTTSVPRRQAERLARGRQELAEHARRPAAPRPAWPRRRRTPRTPRRPRRACAGRAASWTRRSTGRRPRARTAPARRTTPGSRKRRARPCTAGASRRSQAILAATWPPSRFVPVRSYSRSGGDPLRDVAARLVAAAVHPDDRVVHRRAVARRPPRARRAASRRRRAATRSASTPRVASRTVRPMAASQARGVLLGPARPRVAHVVALVGRREQLAVGGAHELRARALGADVDRRRRGRAARHASSSPGPRR